MIYKSRYVMAFFFRITRSQNNVEHNMNAFAPSIHCIKYYWILCHDRVTDSFKFAIGRGSECILQSNIFSTFGCNGIKIRESYIWQVGNISQNDYNSIVMFSCDVSFLERSFCIRWMITYQFAITFTDIWKGWHTPVASFVDMNIL